MLFFSISSGRPIPIYILPGEWVMFNCSVNHNDLNAQILNSKREILHVDNNQIKILSKNVFNVTNLTKSDIYTCNRCQVRYNVMVQSGKTTQYDKWYPKLLLTQLIVFALTRKFWRNFIRLLNLFFLTWSLFCEITQAWNWITVLYIPEIPSYQVPLITKEPDKTIYDYKERVTLNCKLIGPSYLIAIYYRISWKRNGKTEKECKRDCKLPINITPESVGSYECSIERKLVHYKSSQKVTIKLKGKLISYFV